MSKVLRCLVCVLLLCGHKFVLPTAGQLVQADHLSWSVVFDYSKMAPALVIYTLSESDFRGSNTSKSRHFKQDYLLPPPRVKNSSFAFDGYQRGHLCPSADRDGRKDWYKDTYFTSNVLPMTSEVNSGAWRDIEIQCRRLAVNGHRLRIGVGALWPSHPDTVSTKAVKWFPAAFWKVARCLIHPSETWTWIVPNERGRVVADSCRSRVSEIERRGNETTRKMIALWKNL